MVTAIDFFCGAGGSSTGMVAAGVEVRGAANHWALAIETHNTNHPSTEHYLDDLMQAHPANFPYADICWMSPECTNHSLAKGRKRKNITQMDLWGNTQVDPDEERSRGTMREVVEFAEYHQYPIVIVENVVDIRHWAHYDDWLLAMQNLGYAYRTLYLNAQFLGVPQSRDRWYTVFWRKGNKAPALDFRPAAWCEQHGEVQAVQAFKRQQWGRYGKGRQYVYRCPACGCEVYPSTVPAAAVIDWSIPAPLIGERERPLKPRTIERIKAGLRKFAGEAVQVELSHGSNDPAQMVDTVQHPMRTQTTAQTLGLAVPPFLMSYYTRDNAQSRTDEPLPVVTTEKRHALVLPPFITPLRGTAVSTGIDQPLSTIVAAASQHALVMSYYGGNSVYALVSQPLPTMRTVAHEALIQVDSDAVVEACGFRMLEPDELKRGMSFPDEYIILGSKRDQVRQVGNAVACNVAEWITWRCVEALS